jgi:hypothetical protein
LPIPMIATRTLFCFFVILNPFLCCLKTATFVDEKPRGIHPVASGIKSIFSNDFVAKNKQA